MPAKRALIPAALCLGLLGTTTQVLIIRELLVAFTGNELTIATTLAFWLLFVAGGCLLWKRAATRHRTSTPAGLLLIGAGCAAVLQVAAIRLVHPLAVTFGEIPAPGVVMLLSAIGVAPSGMILGAVFVSLVALADRSPARLPVSAIYGAETIGSGIAGTLVGLFLSEVLNPVAIAALAALVGLAAGGYLLLEDGIRRHRAGSAFTVLCLAALAAVLSLSGDIDLDTRGIQWRPLEVAETVDSRYGNIVVTERGGIHDFFETGVLAFTIPDPLYAEECAHIPLLHHPGPKDVLLIGGAGSGLVAEVAKHPSVGHITYVELDPAVLRLAGKYSPSGWLAAPGIETTPVYGDGRSFVAGAPAPFDVVIVSVGMPVSLQVNRYYTAEFFELVRSVLQPDGILALKIPSEGAYLSPELASLLAALMNACRRSFASVEALPGDYIHLLASPRLDLASRRDALRETLRKRGLETSYITDAALRDRLSPFRSAVLDSLIRKHDTGIVNTDGRSVSFSYAIGLWARQFRTGRFVQAVTSWLNLRKCVAVLLLLCLATAITHLRFSGCPWPALPAAIGVYSMGFTTMFCQILIVLSFQIVSGYVYTRIAVIVAAFMVGMGAAAIITGLRHRGAQRPATLVILQGGFVFVPLLILLALNQLKSPGAGFPHAADAVFMGLALLTGALGGTVFATASSIMTDLSPGRVDAGAIAYSVDLIGACLAGFTTGLFIVPALGIGQSAYAVAAANLALVVILIGLARVRLRAPAR